MPRLLHPPCREERDIYQSEWLLEQWQTQLEARREDLLCALGCGGAAAGQHGQPAEAEGEGESKGAA